MKSVAAWDALKWDDLSWEFLRSEFAGGGYAYTPLERRLDSYLRHHGLHEIVNDGTAYGRLLKCVIANIGVARRRGVIGADANAPFPDRDASRTGDVVDDRVLQDAVRLACRAPSLHNSQPWRWVADRGALHLFADRSRLLPAADSAGRDLLLSCGAALDHLRVAMAGAGWETTVERLPDAQEPDHLAALTFHRSEAATGAQRRRADAIPRRRTDRSPYEAPAKWSEVEPRLRSSVVAHDVLVDVVQDSDRLTLALASRLTETLREYDDTYQAELEWWTSPYADGEGIPPEALPVESASSHTDVTRFFPSGGRDYHGHAIGDDQAKILVLSTHEQADRLDVLRCGEALSAVLLEGTVAGLASCTLTHLTDSTLHCDVVRSLTGAIGSPQVLIRFGWATAATEPRPMTPRRPLAEVLNAGPP